MLPSPPQTAPSVFDVDPTDLPPALRDAIGAAPSPAPASAATPVASCCAPSEQETCCEPSDKGACCGTEATAGGGCGCR